MTTLTCNARMLAAQWESGASMVKRNVHPLCRFVAGSAVCSELTLVMIILPMARETIHRRAFICLVDMAFLAGYVGVRIGQLEGDAIVIKISRFPTIGKMTRCAIRSQSALVRIILGVTGETILRGVF